MSQLSERLKETFKNEDARYAYAETFQNAFIAAQIKELRGERSQQEIADAIGTKQSGISRIENVNYSAWKVETLRKLARAFGVRLRISFEEFGTLIPEVESFGKTSLHRRSFNDDPACKEPVKRTEQQSDQLAALQAQILDLTKNAFANGGAMLASAIIPEEVWKQREKRFAASLARSALHELGPFLNPEHINSALLAQAEAPISHSLAPEGTANVLLQNPEPTETRHAGKLMGLPRRPVESATNPILSEQVKKRA